MFLEDDGLTLNEIRCCQNLYTEFVFYFTKKCTIKNQCSLLLPPIMASRKNHSRKRVRLEEAQETRQKHHEGIKRTKI